MPQFFATKYYQSLQDRYVPIKPVVFTLKNKPTWLCIKLVIIPLIYLEFSIFDNVFIRFIAVDVLPCTNPRIFSRRITNPGVCKLDWSPWFRSVKWVLAHSHDYHPTPRWPSTRCRLKSIYQMRKPSWAKTQPGTVEVFPAWYWNRVPEYRPGR